KVRMPLPATDNDTLMPENITQLAESMSATYRTGEQWWSGSPQPETTENHADLLAALEEGLHG
ncbi:hypothetical protein SP747_005267, partial [Salmonella enterica]|nr:hypothetical protein [Salmonella enterica]